STLLELFEKLDAFRKPLRLEQFAMVCAADARGRLGKFETDYPQADLLRHAFVAACAIKAAPFVEQGLQGPAIAEAMRRARVLAVARVKSETAPPADT
ncbi:MAG: multifunctional CCA tRNA nucleotidyl transferase/2'3'-cyclic phosphodiesterase/2'nucleotidase/phosphatase, partial [Dokdonella sp.]